jgi:hypothetical protein
MNMKSKFLVLGCLIAGMCFLTSCKEEDDKPEIPKNTSITAISISPATVAAMEVNATVELTAAITPADAKESFEWVSSNTAIATVTATAGTNKATIKAIAPGTITVFARNAAKTVVSNDVSITVNRPVSEEDIAEALVKDGPFKGGANAYGGAFRNIDVGISFTRVAKNEVTVKMQSSIGILECRDDQTIKISTGTAANTYILEGKTTMDGMGYILRMNIQGTYNTSTKKLTLELLDDHGWNPPMDMSITAEPGLYEPVVEPDYLLNCWGTLSMFDVPTEIKDIEVGIFDNGSLIGVSFTIPKVDLFGVAVMDLVFEGMLNLSAENELSGEILMTLAGTHSMKPVSGTFDRVNKTILLNFSGKPSVLGNTLNIAVSITNIPDTDDPDYAKEIVGTYKGNGTMTGMMSGAVTDVVIDLEYVNNFKVNATIVANLPTLGKQTIKTDLSVSENFELSGSTSIMNFAFTITGVADPDAKTLALKLASTGIATIDLTTTLEK